MVTLACRALGTTTCTRWICTSVTPSAGCRFPVHSRTTLTARFGLTILTRPLGHLCHVVRTVVWPRCAATWTRRITIATLVTVPLGLASRMVVRVFIGSGLPTPTTARWKCTLHAPVLVLPRHCTALEAFFGKTCLASPFRLVLGMIFCVATWALCDAAAIALWICTIATPRAWCCICVQRLGTLDTSLWGFLIFGSASTTDTGIGCGRVHAQVGHTHGFVALDADALLCRGCSRRGFTGFAAQTS